MVGHRGADRLVGSRALELIDEASSDLGSRFFIRIREEMGLAYFVGASQMRGLARVLLIWTDPAKLEVKSALLDEIGKSANAGLTSR
jgi:zinc protease